MTSTALELVETVVGLPEVELTLLRPRDSEALLDEEAFERDEYMPYWAELWPSGLALARTACRRGLRDARMIELGCGLGVPSLAAALRGAHVLATDWSVDALALVALNGRRNGVELELAACSWAEPDPVVDAGPWDIVLAADVLYERRNVELLVDLLPRLGREALVADPGRPAAKAFLDGATAHGWAATTEYDDLAPHVAIHRLTRARG